MNLIFFCYDDEKDNTIDAINQSDLIKKNILFIKNEYKGAHGAVMTGISKSKSDVVLVIPADDNYNTANLDEMLNKIKSKK